MSILSAAKGAWGLTRAGTAMANAVKGKQAQVAAAAITTFLGLLIAFGKQHLGVDVMPYIVAVAQFFGMDSGQFMAGLGVAVYGLANWILTVVTTDKVGITGRTAPGGSAVPADSGAAAAPVPPQPAPDPAPEADLRSGA